MGVPPLTGDGADTLDSDTSIGVAHLIHRRRQLDNECEQLTKRLKLDGDAEEHFLTKEGAAFLKRKLEEEASNSSSTLRGLGAVVESFRGDA